MACLPGQCPRVDTCDDRIVVQSHGLSLTRPEKVGWPVCLDRAPELMPVMTELMKSDVRKWFVAGTKPER